MSSLQVLCPNGRRQNVKTTPNTKLLQVLEEVCQKQKFLPSEDYKLIHGRNTLDLTLSVRFSNLANNAKLELVKCERSRAESDVVIALQLENGERLQHTFKPDTTLWDILQHCETIIDRQENVQFHTLDLTLSVRFSNLSDNAKLELVKCERSRAESDVVIALQLENGERLQHTFKPGTTLWDILQHCETITDSKVTGQLTSVDNSVSPALHPVCIYMTEEVCGETLLKHTKLRKLGLVGGKAVIRYAKRPINEKAMQESEKLAKEALKKEEKLAKRQSSQNETDKVSQSTSSSSKHSVTESQSTTIMETQSGAKIVTSTSNVISDGKSETATISLNINVNIQNDNKPVVQDTDRTAVEEPATKMVKTDHDQTADPDLSEPMEVEQADGTESVMETEDSVKETAQDSVSVRQAQAEAAQSIRDLNIPGLEVFTPQDFLDLPPDQQQVAQQLAAALLPRLLQKQGQGQSETGKKKEKQRALPPPPAQTGVVDFKFPEATKGQKLYKNELNEYRKEDYQPCDRNTLVYSLLEKEEKDADNSVTVKTEELPEEFFEVTESDIRSLVAAQKKKLDEMENQPLMTSSMRKARLESLYSKYDRVVIRVQFTDKLVLQGFFRPRETVFAVKKFVKEHLQDKATSFYLYTSPPKCELKDDSQTLIEAHLVPATIVYCGSSDQSTDHFLSDECLSNTKSRLDADILAAECLRSSADANDDTSQSPYSGKGKQPMYKRNKSDNASQPSTSTSGASSKESSSSGPDKVPKWFKVGKK